MMEDTLLIDAAERFARGEMSAEEKIYFEDLRKNNPDLDQAVVEQLFFLNQLDQYSSTKNFKNIIGEVENKLITEQFLTRSVPASQGKLVTLWVRYRKTIAVAASIAGVVSLLIATLVSSVTTTKQQNLTPLVAKINDVEKNNSRIEKKIDRLQATAVTGNAVSPVESRFRATGFMIDATGNYIVTNAHVIKEAAHALVVENMKGNQYLAKAVYVNPENDLAVIKIVDDNFKKLAPMPYTIRRTGAELGEQIFMLGYPKPEIVYGEGYVSAKNGYQMDTVYCQLSTSANAGNSGSPVLTKSGELIGIITSSETNAQGVVFAIKSSNIYRAVDEVKKMPEYQSIKINSVPSLKNLPREKQINKMEDYVFMIKGN